MRKNHRTSLAILAALACTACGSEANLLVERGIGPDPELPKPEKSLIPTVNIAPAVGWADGGRPVAAEGTEVVAFADGLDHPRWLYVLPNGDVLVAETAAPERPEDGKGIKGFFMKKAMKRAGSAVPSANRITLLRDQDGDGIAEQRSAFLTNLNSPFGMVLVGSDLYVANTDALMRFPYRAGDTAITEPGVKVTDLPGGALNHHWTKNVIASPDGTQLVRHRRLEQQRGRARDGQGSRAGGDPGDRSAHRLAHGLRIGPAQPERPCLGADDRHAVDRGQRTRRARQRPRPGLPHVGPTRRILRLAVQLLRTDRR